MLVLAPVRGEKLHIPKGVIGRPFPTPGQQTVWPALCGRRIYAHAAESRDADLAKLPLCKRCEAAVA